MLRPYYIHTYIAGAFHERTHRPPRRAPPENPHPDRPGDVGAPRRPRGAAVAALRAGLRRGREEDLRLHRRAGRAADLPGGRGARRPDPVPPPEPALHRGAHIPRLARASRAVRVADAVRQRRRVRHGPPVHRDQLGHLEAARRRRAPERAGPRAGARHERARALPHDPGAHSQREPRRPAVSRGHRDPADPARAARVVPQERAVVRPRGRAATLDRRGPLQPRARRGVHAPRPGGGAAPHRQGHRRGPRSLHERSEGRRGRRGGHRQTGRPGLLGRLQKEVNVLVVGGGGREHALCWALKRDTPEATLFAAPGNPGTAQLGTNLEIPATAVDALVAAVREHRIDLTIVGPEAPLAAGLGDRLRAAGHAVLGPSRAAARIESSKAFAKDVMRRAGVQSPESRSFTALEPALAYIRAHTEPLVVKASGLAAGKGAVVCGTREEAARTARAMLAEGALGDAGREIVVEDFLEGEELSVLALTDGERMLVLPAAQDHKRLRDGDTGPNTGGMGAYCPVSFATPELLERVRRQVLEPTVHQLAAEGAPYQGVLYAGLMLAPPDGTPYVLE